MYIREFINVYLSYILYKNVCYFVSRYNELFIKNVFFTPMVIFLVYTYAHFMFAQKALMCWGYFLEKQEDTSPMLVDTHANNP